MIDIVRLRDKIESLPKLHHKEVARILIAHAAAIDENKNGMFVNLSKVPEDVVEKIATYVSYVDLQQQTLSSGETEREDLKVQYFTD